jgi:hypothetical protein
VISSVWEMIEGRLRRLANDHHHRGVNAPPHHQPSSSKEGFHPSQRPHTRIIRPIPNRRQTYPYLTQTYPRPRARDSYSYIAPISSNRAIVPSSHQHTLWARMYALPRSRYQALYARKRRYRPTVFGRRLSSDRSYM